MKFRVIYIKGIQIGGWLELITKRSPPELPKPKALAEFLFPIRHCVTERDEHTDVNVAIFVESVDDEGEDEANVAGVVIS